MHLNDKNNPKSLELILTITIALTTLSFFNVILYKNENVLFYCRRKKPPNKII